MRHKSVIRHKRETMGRGMIEKLNQSNWIVFELDLLRSNIGEDLPINLEWEAMHINFLFSPNEGF